METNFSPVYLDNLPPDVSPNQCFTLEQLHRIPEDFSLAEELIKNAGKPPFPADTDVRQIQFFINQRLGFPGTMDTSLFRFICNCLKILCQNLLFTPLTAN
ncbi:MAG: hypothetical protein HC820_05540 [Hydrococcus sp. RM1_1_31]|nr:hypothetical protein [Hydrococcus sp. RM1_1_31]